MKKLFYIFLMFTGVLYMNACDSDNGEEILPSPVVSSDVSFSAKGGSGKIEISQAITKVTADQQWCEVSASGTTATVTVPPNEELLGRTARVAIYTNDRVTSIPVSQTGVILDCESEYVQAGKTAFLQKLHVSSTLDWTASVPDTVTWCNITKETDSLVISILPNAGKPRSTVVTIKAGQAEFFVEVQQKGTVPLNELFVTTSDSWYFDSKKMSSTVLQFFSMINQQVAADGEMLYQMAITPAKGLFNLSFVSIITGTTQGYTGNLSLTVNMVEGSNDAIQITFNRTGDNNGMFYYQNFSSFRYMISLLTIQPYILTADDPDEPTSITFTGTQDKGFSFTLVNTPVQNP